MEKYKLQCNSLIENVKGEYIKVSDILPKLQKILNINFYGYYAPDVQSTIKSLISEISDVNSPVSLFDKAPIISAQEVRDYQANLKDLRYCEEQINSAKKSGSVGCIFHPNKLGQLDRTISELETLGYKVTSGEGLFFISWGKL